MSRRINSISSKLTSDNTYYIWFILFLISFFLTFFSIMVSDKLPSMLGLFIVASTGYAAGFKNAVALLKSKN